MTDAAELVRTVPHALVNAATTARGIRLVDRDLRERELSYAELADGAARVARRLTDLGTIPGDRVCILGPTTEALVKVLFGTWWAGAVPVVLSLPRRRSDVDALAAEVASRADGVGARVLAVADLFAELAPVPDVRACVTSIEGLCEDGPPLAPADLGPDDLAYLQFTSGTTANPRAVALAHAHLITNMTAAGAMAGVDVERDVFVSWLPLFHDMGLIGMLVGSVLFTNDLVLIPTEEFLGRPGVWADAMSRYRGTITASPNFGYGLAARDLRAKPRSLDLSSWRIAANGAEPIDVETCERFVAEAGAYGFNANAMCPMFGLAEATLAVTLARTDEPIHVELVDRDALGDDGIARPARGNDAKALVACGYPLPGHEVQITSEDGRTLPDGRVGEICVRGPSVMLGYWNDPDATAASLRDGWLHTGDLGYIGEHGLVVCGRRKDMIILGGRNIYPEDYEVHAERVPGIRKGNVIAFALPEVERMVVVAETTVEADQAPAVARDALEHLRRALPRGPEEVVLVHPGTLPKTTSGKRQRGTCRERYSSGTLATLAAAR
jgi:fatty-acyl-CoA synthase